MLAFELGRTFERRLHSQKGGRGDRPTTRQVVRLLAGRNAGVWGSRNGRSLVFVREAAKVALDRGPCPCPLLVLVPALPGAARSRLSSQSSVPPSGRSVLLQFAPAEGRSPRLPYPFQWPPRTVDWFPDRRIDRDLADSGRTWPSLVVRGASPALAERRSPPRSGRVGTERFLYRT